MAPKRKRSGGRNGTAPKKSKSGDKTQSSHAPEPVSQVPTLPRNDSPLLPPQSPYRAENPNPMPAQRRIENPQLEEFTMKDIQSHAEAKFDALMDHFRVESNGIHLIDPLIQPDRLLSAEQLFVPIMAVTEAIRPHRRLRCHEREEAEDEAEDEDNEEDDKEDDEEAKEYPFYDVTDHVRIDLAKIITSNNVDNLGSMRPRRPLLIPWVYNAVDQRLVQGQTGESITTAVGEQVREQESDGRAHIFLVLVRMEQEVCELRFYDSFQYLAFRYGREWESVRATIRNVVRNIEWFRTDDVDSSEVQFAPDVEVRVAHQDNHWCCGIYTILNAWTIAMNLVPNPEFTVVDQNNAEHVWWYGRAAEVINLGVAGYANSDLIYTFLVGHGFALPTKWRKECPNFGQLTTAHKIRDVESLRQHIENCQRDKSPIRGCIRPVRPRSGNHGQGLREQTQQPGGKGPAGGPGHSTEQAPASRQAKPPQPINESGRISPSVMGLREFNNQDCATVWHDLNQKKSLKKIMIKDHKRPSEESIREFAGYYLWRLNREHASALNPLEILNAFHAARRPFEEALNFDWRAHSPDARPTERVQNLTHWQVGTFRILARNTPVSVGQRNGLIRAHLDLLEELNAAAAGSPIATQVRTNVNSDILEGETTRPET